MNLQLQLDQLENAELVRWSGVDTYAFKHTLTQETSYGSLLKPQRRKLHRAVAQAYEELYPERLDEFAALLTEHYAEAEDAAKTLEYAARAGDAAARVYANAEAIGHYSQALKSARRMAPALPPAGIGATGANMLQELYLKRGRAFEVSGRYEQALHNYEEMKALALERKDQGLELQALMASATLHSIPGRANNPLQARGLATQALALAQELRVRAAEAKIYWNLMLLENWGGGDPQRAVEFGQKSLALAREFGLQEQLAYTLHDLAMAYALARQPDRAAASQKEATDLWRQSNNLPMYAESLNRAVLVHVNAGNFDAAIASALQAYQLTQAIGNVIGEGLASLGLSLISAALGLFDQAIEYGDNTLRCAQESPVGAIALSVQNALAWIYGSLGMIEKGIEIAREGLNQATRSVFGEDRYRIDLARSSFQATLIRLELLRGNLAKAQGILSQAPLAMIEDNLTMPSYDGNPIFLAVGELRLAEGDYASAGDVVDQYIAALQRVPSRPFLPGAYFLKGKILAAQGQDEPAAQVWRTAHREAEAMNLHPTLWQILAALAASSDRQGRHAEAAQLLDQARASVQYIADHSPADLRASFLALPQLPQVAGAGAHAGERGREAKYKSR